MTNLGALRALRSWPMKFGRRSAVQVGRAFFFGGRDLVGVDDGPLRLGPSQTPISALVKNEVAFKLYLTLVMMTKTPPHGLHKPRVLAELAEVLGYDELHNFKPGPGTRRVKRAMDLLESRNLVRMTTGIEMRSDFTVMVAHMPEAEEAPFLSIPTSLWSHGWILEMDAPTLATYTYLRFLGARKGHAVALDPVDRAKTGLSDDTFRRGTASLVRLGIADQRPFVIEDYLGRRRPVSKALLIDDGRIAQEQVTNKALPKDHWDKQWADAT